MEEENHRAKVMTAVEDVARARLEESRQSGTITEAMSRYGSLWGDSGRPSDWSSAQALVADGRWEDAIVTLSRSAGPWPMDGAPPTHLLDLLHNALEITRYREEREATLGRLEAAPLIRGATPEDSLPVRVIDPASAPAVAALDVQIATVAESAPSLREAGVIRRRFDALLEAFLAAPAELAADRWCAVVLARGTAAILDGDDAAGRAWLVQAAAVAGGPLPEEAVPPSMRPLFRAAEEEARSTTRGLLQLSAQPGATVSVDGRVVSTVFGEAEVLVVPGLHLVTVDAEPGAPGTSAVLSVASGGTATLRWTPRAGAAADTGPEYPSHDGRLGLAPEYGEVGVSDRWRLGVFSGITVGADSLAVGGGASLTWHRWAMDVRSELAVSAFAQPVLVTSNQRTVRLPMWSGVVSWTAGRGLVGQVGGGVFIAPGFAAGPCIRAGAAYPWRRTRFGMALEVGADGTSHAPEVPRVWSAATLAVEAALPGRRPIQ